MQTEELKNLIISALRDQLEPIHRKLQKIDEDLQNIKSKFCGDQKLQDDPLMEKLLLIENEFQNFKVEINEARKEAKSNQENIGSKLQELEGNIKQNQVFIQNLQHQGAKQAEESQQCFPPSQQPYQVSQNSQNNQSKVPVSSNTYPNLEYVVKTNTGKKYHNLKGCESVQGKTFQILKQQAIAEGLIPCQICKP